MYQVVHRSLDFYPLHTTYMSGTLLPTLLFYEIYLFSQVSYMIFYLRRTKFTEQYGYMKVHGASGLQDFESLINVLLRLELVVVDQGNDALSIHNIGLAPRESPKEIGRHAKFFPQLVAFITKKSVWQIILLLECLHQEALH